MLLYLLLVAVSPLLIAVYSQEPPKISQADGFVFDGPAAGGQSSSGQQRTTTSTESTRGTTSTTALPEQQFNQCISACPVTMEYNPVCGTDMTDYTNPGGLGCAQRCGKEVSLNYYGRCSTGTAG